MSTLFAASRPMPAAGGCRYPSCTLDARMPEGFLDNLGMDARRQEHRGVAMAQIVELHAELERPAQRTKRLGDPARAEGRPSGSQQIKSWSCQSRPIRNRSSAWRVRWRRSASTANAGRSTRRCDRSVFGCFNAVQTRTLGERRAFRWQVRWQNRRTVWKPSAMSVTWSAARFSRSSRPVPTKAFDRAHCEWSACSLWRVPHGVGNLPRTLRPGYCRWQPIAGGTPGFAVSRRSYPWRAAFLCFPSFAPSTRR